jgi:hypothetical protein
MKNNSHNYYYQIVAQEICETTNTKFHIYILNIIFRQFGPKY